MNFINLAEERDNRRNVMNLWLAQNAVNLLNRW
jgi:hypothetical protein